MRSKKLYIIILYMSLYQNYDTNAMNSAGVIEDLKNRRNAKLTSAYNTLNTELQARFGNLEGLGGDIEKVSGVIGGGVQTALGIGKSAKKIYNKYKKKATGEDEDDEEGVEPDDIELEPDEEDEIDRMFNLGDYEGTEFFEEPKEFTPTRVEGFNDEQAINNIDDAAETAEDAGTNAIKSLTEGATRVASKVGGFISRRAGNLLNNARNAIQNGAERGQTTINKLVNNVKSRVRPQEPSDPYNTEGNPDEGIEMQTFKDNEPVEDLPADDEDFSPFLDKGTRVIGFDDSEATNAVNNATKSASDAGEVAEAGADAIEGGVEAGETSAIVGSEVAGEAAAGATEVAAGLAAQSLDWIPVVGQIIGAVGLISAVAGGIAMASDAGEKLNEGLKTNAQNLQKQKAQAVNVAGKFSVPSLSTINRFNT